MAEKRKRGRPTAYTEERADRFVAVVRLGGTYKAASAAAGVTEETTIAWRAKKPNFQNRIREAEQMLEVRCLRRLEAAADKGSWQAAAWLLERKNPENYARPQRVSAEQHHSGSIDINLAGHLDTMTRAELDRLARDDDAKG